MIDFPPLLSETACGAGLPPPRSRPQVCLSALARKSICFMKVEEVLNCFKLRSIMKISVAHGESDGVRQNTQQESDSLRD
jgi:hypothetical protein